MAMSENSRKVYDYVKSVDGQNVTAADIAEATGLEIRSVNGVVTSAFQKKGLMERVPAEIEVVNEKGEKSHKAVKFIRLTDAGREFNPDLQEKAE